MYMRVKGKRYDTNAAMLVGTSANSTLYRKKNFEFFLHDKLTDTITPLSWEQADAWGIQNLPHETYIKVFNLDPVLDNGEKIVINLNATNTVINMARHRASQLNLSFTDYIIKLIKDDNTMQDNDFSFDFLKDWYHKLENECPNCHCTETYLYFDPRRNKYFAWCGQCGIATDMYDTKEEVINAFLDGKIKK